MKQSGEGKVVGDIGCVCVSYALSYVHTSSNNFTNSKSLAASGWNLNKPIQSSVCMWVTTTLQL